MDKLFFKVYRNNYIKNIIFQFISIINKNHRYLRFDYYQFPLLSIIKNKNLNLFTEKINNYNKYIINIGDCNNNNNNNRYNYEIFKHYISFNRTSLLELLKWWELPIDIFKLTIQLFKNEFIKLIKELSQDIESVALGRNNHKSKKIKANSTIVTPIYLDLIENCDKDKLEYLINIGLVDPLSIDLSKTNYLNLPKTNVIVSSVFISKLQISKTKSMAEYLYQVLKIEPSFQVIARQLLYVVHYKKSEIYGSLLIDLLPFDQLPNNSFSIRTSPSNSKNTQVMKDLMESILRNNDMFMFRLLLDKFKFNIDSYKSGSVPSDIVCLYDIWVSIKTLERLQISPSYLYQSSFLELVHVLTKHSSSIYLNSDCFLNRIISNPDIAIYLIDNYSMYFHTFKFQITELCKYRLQQHYPLEKYKQVTQLLVTYTQWLDNSMNDYVTIEFINQLPFNFNWVSFELLHYLIEMDKYEFIKCYLNKFPNSFSNQSLEIAIQTENKLITGLFISRIGELPTSHNILDHSSSSRLLYILKYSMEKGCREMVYFISAKLSELEPTEYNNTIISSTLKTWIYDHPTLSRYWFTQPNLPFDYINRLVVAFIDEEIKNGICYYSNYFLRELVSNPLEIISKVKDLYNFKKNILKVTLSYGIPIGFEGISNISRYNSLFKNERIEGLFINIQQAQVNFFDVILHFISFGLVTIDNIKFLLKLSIKHNFQLIIDILLFRNQFKNLQLYPTTNTEYVIDNMDSNNYFNWLHLEILKLSINLRNDNTIKELIKQNYKYTPTSNLFYNNPNLDLNYCNSNTHLVFLNSVGLNSLKNDDLVDKNIILKF